MGRAHAGLRGLRAVIPHTIHRIWLGSPMPSEFAFYGATWQQAHPLWEHVLWTDQDAEFPGVRVMRPPFALRNVGVYDNADHIAPNNVGQLRADVLRYEILEGVGGVYVDADFECLRSIEALTDGLDAFAAWETDGQWVNNAIMGATARHPFFRQLIDGLPANVLAHKGSRPAVMTGPQYVTATYFSDVRLNLPVPTIFPSRLFYPYLWNELDRRGEEFPDAYAVHHWHNRRRLAHA